MVGWFDEPTADRRSDQGAGKAGFPFSAKATLAQYSHSTKNNFRIFLTRGYFKMWGGYASEFSAVVLEGSVIFSRIQEEEFL